MGKRRGPNKERKRESKRERERERERDKQRCINASDDTRVTLAAERPLSRFSRGNEKGNPDSSQQMPQDEKSS